MIPWNYKDMPALKQMADVIYEADEKTTYLGFKKPGEYQVDENEEKWAIMKIVSDELPGTYPRETKFYFANGALGFDLQWTEKLTYVYEYRNWS